jgi:uncharacterized protein YqgC (DUF456 family)
MDAAQTLLLTVTILGMIGAILVAIIPFIPGPPLVWLIAMSYALATGSLPTGALIVMTLVMVVGATSDYWLPFLGVRSQGFSGLSAIGSLIGGLIGTLAIPLPILGTLIGSIAGAMLAELARARQWRQMLRAGQITLKLYLWGVVVQFSFSVAIFLIFLGTLAAAR